MNDQKKTTAKLHDSKGKLFNKAWRKGSVGNKEIGVPVLWHTITIFLAWEWLDK